MPALLISNDDVAQRQVIVVSELPRGVRLMGVQGRAETFM